MSYLIEFDDPFKPYERVHHLTNLSHLIKKDALNLFKKIVHNFTFELI